MLGSQQAASNQPTTRIETDVETVKAMIDRLESTTQRIIRHARALGYYEPTPGNSVVSAPTPVITTLADALQALSRAVDHCSGSLNVYD